MGRPQGRPARRREAHRRGRLPNPAQLLHSLRPGGREARAHGGASGRRRGFALPHRRVDGGGQVGAKGPDRELFYLGARRRRTALAGRRGSGIAPLMAMIRHRAAVGSGIPCRLLYSSRSYEEIIYREELEKLAPRDSALEVINTLTRSRPEGWTGYHRRIDADMLREVAWSPDESPLVFACGPTSFVEGVADALVNLAHDPARVKTERFGPTGG